MQALKTLVDFGPIANEFLVLIQDITSQLYTWQRLHSGLKVWAGKGEQDLSFYRNNFKEELKPIAGWSHNFASFAIPIYWINEGLWSAVLATQHV